MVPVLAMTSAHTASLDSMVGAQGVMMPPYPSIASTLHCMHAQLIMLPAVLQHPSSCHPNGSMSCKQLFICRSPDALTQPTGTMLPLLLCVDTHHVDPGALSVCALQVQNGTQTANSSHLLADCHCVYTCGASVGRTMYAGMPLILAATATAPAWLPELCAITPRAACCSGSDMI